MLTEDDTNRTHNEDMLDLLRGVPGVNVCEYGGRGNAAISIRGGGRFGSRSIDVLVDGLSLKGGTGFIAVNFIPLDNIERIEIIKDPASALYGAQAMGGVINIITKTAQKPLEASGRINYGSFDTQTYRPAFRGFRGPFQ